LSRKKRKNSLSIDMLYQKLMKSSFLVVASFVLAIAMGSAVSRVLFPFFPSLDFVAGAVSAAVIVGLFLLFSGYAYRRWSFSSSRNCVMGVVMYVVASTLFVAYATGADAIAGFFEGWFFWLMISTLAPWFAGFWLADRAAYRSRRHA